MERSGVPWGWVRNAIAAAMADKPSAGLGSTDEVDSGEAETPPGGRLGIRSGGGILPFS